jgi:tetratricopeptide (TPR) repeat protein
LFGREFGINVLERAGDAPRDAVLRAIEETAGARIIAEIPASPGHYSFCHSLIRETLYGELTTTRRVQLHRRVGEALESIHQLRPEPHLAELAHHFFEAAQGGDPEKALQYALRAGDRAAEQMAHEEAARYYEMGLQVLEGADPSAGTRVLDLLLKLSEAWWRAGEVEKAKDASLRAVEVARNLNAPEHFARAALGVAGHLPAFGAVISDENVIALFEETLKILPDRDSPVRARVMARLAEEHMLTESHERRWSLSCEAVDMARRIGDPVVLVEVLKCTFLGRWDPLALAERLAVSDEIIQLASEIGDRGFGLEGRIFRFLTLVESGDDAGAHKELEVCARIAGDLRQPYHQFLIGVLRGCEAFMSGHLNDVERLAQAAMALGEAAHTQNGPLLCGVQLGRLRWLQGRFEEVEPMLMGFGAMYPFLSATVGGALAATYSEQGRFAGAQAQLDAIGDLGAIPRHVSWHATLAFMAEAAGALRDAKHAAPLYDLMRPLDGRNLMQLPSMTLGPAAYYLGLLAQALDCLEAAARHFEDALAFDARTGAMHYQARTQVAYAEMLLRRGERGDSARAAELLQASVATARRLGMTKLAERAGDLIAQIPGDVFVAELGEPALPPNAQDEQLRPHKAPERDPWTVLLRREAEFWTVAQHHIVLRLKDVKGLHYLAHLLKHPDREFHALELVAAAPEGTGPGGERRRSGSEDDEVLDLDGLGAVLDETAKAQYRKRRDGLQAQLQEAERNNDIGRAAALRAEIDALNQQLAGAIDLGGRDRNPGSSSERARLTVTKGIKSVINKIRSGNPSLARYLATQVRTGHVCCYTTDPDRPIRWIF